MIMFIFVGLILAFCLGFIWLGEREQKKASQLNNSHKK